MGISEGTILRLPFAETPHSVGGFRFYGDVEKHVAAVATTFLRTKKTAATLLADFLNNRPSQFRFQQMPRQGYNLICMPKQRATSGRFRENGLPLCLFIAIAFISFREYIIGGMVPFARDDALIYQVTRKFIVDSIKGGHIPLWCPYVGMGYPIAAEGECGLFNPFTFLFFLFSFYKAYTLSIIICYPLFAFFLYRLGRTWGLARAGALLCAVAVTYAGAYIFWQGHSPIINTLLWFPLLLMFLIRACRGEGRTNIYIAGLLYALMIFSGNPQFIYGGTIFAVLFLWTIGDGGKGFRLLRVLGTAIPAFIIGVSVGAVQLIPLFELMMHSERAGGVFDTAAGSLNWNGLMALGAPILYGAHGVDWAPEATNGYIGYAGTFLALIGFGFLPRRTSAVILAAIVIALSFGGWTNLGLFRVASRMLFFLGFTGGILAGYGLDSLIKTAWGDALTRLRVIAAGVVLIFLSLLAGAYFIVSEPSEYIYLLLPPVIIAAALLIILALPKVHPAIITSIIIVTTLAGSVYIYGIGTSVTAVPSAELGRTPEVAEALSRLDGDGRIWIMLGERNDDALYFHDSVYGPRACMYNIATPEHETPLFLKGVRRFHRMALASITGITAAKAKTPMPDADVLAGVRYIAVTPEAAPLLRYPEAYREDKSELPFVVEEVTGYSGLAFFIFPRTVECVQGRNDEPRIDGFVKDDGGVVGSLVLQGTTREINKEPAKCKAEVITRFKDPNSISIRYSAPVNSFLFISQVNYPGWRAYINGKSTHLYGAYGIFCGVVVDEPEGVVELAYRPLSWMVGGGISIISLILWAWLMVNGRKKTFKESDNPILDTGALSYRIGLLSLR